MPLDRRQFLQASAVLGGAASLGLVPTPLRAAGHAAFDAAARRPTPGRAPRALRILILGGTGFIGPAQVRYARERGHTLTLFNRGRTNADLFPDVETLIGDRNAPDGYAALEGDRTWDVVIDNPTTLPRWVNDAADALDGRTSHYMFVSTISVFRDYSQPGMGEDGPLHPPADADTERMTSGAQYGPLKVRSEMVARERFGDATTVVRPGLIVGPGDRSDRFVYWPVRVARGGEILAPGTPDDPVQYVDARDLGEWMIRLAEQRAFGTFNATGPATPTTIAEMLYGIKATVSNDARFTWVPAEFLAQQQVRPWSDMPVWVPPAGGMAGFARVDCSRAIAAGLSFRPLAETARDTLAWHRERPAERQAELRAGLAAEREAEVLAAWHASRGEG